ncbi:beta-lactamase/transpeptidase-like protein [Periconia macrospinosa]|uniref:Beta-lactamase/transpeptidase-like protein n=1 Tax=Periconia macrospinosa TaxID=97972 RepID=A0A2V1E4H2_9PLEO|nr:beta-lactamase/transpeptidase-like protein [Periconia macrospinosa]
MPVSFRNLAVISLCATSPAFADLLGPRYLPPVDLTSDKSTVSAAWKNITSTFEKFLDEKNANATGGIPGIRNMTFSAGMFALNDPSASKHQFHFSSPALQLTNGTRKVDGDSLYRAASITKVLTVLTGLLNLKITDWERPLTEIFPALGEFAKERPGKDDPVNTIQWENITPNTLASQISGLPTNLLASELAIIFMENDINGFERGYPAVDMNSSILSDAIPALIAQAGGITIDNFIPTIEARQPNFEPWTSPLYSNNGFILLTAVLQNITAKALPVLSQESIFDPLKMSSSYYNQVPESESKRSVRIFDVEWAAKPNILSGSGGLVTTLNDLAKFGTAVLNSTLLPKHETRRWMKPITHTASFQYSMGRPWEILRYTHTSGAVTDLYTKAGDSGTASSFLVLIPDYNVGFTILGASADENKNAIVGKIGDVISNALLPALEAQATKETVANFAGTYVSTVEGLNSSVVLCHNDTEGAAPGLLIKSLISNGTAFKFDLYYSPGARLTPSVLSDKTGKVGFRVSTAADAPSIDKSKALFSGGGSSDFLIGDAQSYGGASLSHWSAQVDKDGKATTLSLAWLRLTLKRKE